ncbi:GNAT family N-acetyltransferase [Roseibium algae]|uniref:GNAT family N-acetyltransferase n=1 Tax=Roseibium algae TaxID=3123038 RepID=A0ABU8TRC6_9HYPH
MNDLIIRPLKASDCAEWASLWHGYLTYYKLADLPQAVTDDLFERLLGKGGHFGLVAERQGKLVGFVHSLPHDSTWSLQQTCYLEDLYVDAEQRGGGVGRKLIEAVSAEAERLGCHKVYWHTEENNTRARQLYDRIGTLSDFVKYDRR